MTLPTRQIAKRARKRRLEFTKAVKIEMFRRAGGPDKLCCEGCCRPLMGKPFEYDHTLECWEMEDVEHGYREPLTAADGKLLGKDCCHDPKTKRKTGERAHGKRILSKAAKAERKKSRGFRGWTKFDGTPVYAKDRS